jgi:3-oxoacyl-[acyl-carrier-protein] synthase-3
VLEASGCGIEKRRKSVSAQIAFMNAKFSHAEIAGVVVKPGSVVRRFGDEVLSYGGDVAQIERIKKAVGLVERRVVSEGVTTLDLCESAARELLSTITPKVSLDAVIFVTQTPDHLQPGNAALLHGRLALPKTTLAFDVNLGCSGYIYGLYLASLMVECGGCENILLCAGDTLSQCVHPQDRATAPLFGDAGSATLVRRSATPIYSWFSLNTDGSGAGAIRIPAGGFRQPHTAKTAEPLTDGDGNTRTLENIHMDGAAVFNFSLREVPVSLRQMLEFSGKTIAEIDMFVLHQANRYILQNIAKRCGIPMARMPMESLARFGNTSSASIPLAMADFFNETKNEISQKTQTVLLSGFGVGLSWGNAVVLLPANCCKLIA